MPAASRYRLAPAALSAALTLLLPAPWQGLTLALTSLSAAWFAAPESEQPDESEAWRIAPDSPPPEECEGLLIDPRALTEGERCRAKIWMGTQPVDGSKFRSLPGATLFSAACALTEAETLALTGSSAEDLRAWQTSLGIRPQRLQAQYPRVEEAKIGAFRGAIVRDGAEERAYFVGPPALMGACTAVLDERGQARPVLAGDRKHAETLPRGLICYATSLVKDGKLVELTWLGGAEPYREWAARPEAIAQAQVLDRLLPLYYDPKEADAERIAAALMPSLLPARQGQALLRLLPQGGEMDSLLPEPSLIERWRHRHRHTRFRRLALFAAALAVALPACMALFLGPGGAGLGLAGLLCCLLPNFSAYLCAGLPLRERKHFPSDLRLMLSVLPTLAVALILGLLAGTLVPAALVSAGIGASWAVGSVAALIFPASIRDAEQRKRIELLCLALSAGVLLLLLLLLRALPLNGLGLLFGLALGLGCAVIRQLIASV